MSRAAGAPWGRFSNLPVNLRSHQRALGWNAAGKTGGDEIGRTGQVPVREVPAALLCRMPAQFEGKIDLLAKNAFEPFPDISGFTQFQTEAHRILCLFVGQSHVAVTFFPSHFPSKPGRRFESSAAGAVGEFHLRYHEAGVSTLININLNN